jgi:bacillolysin
VKAAAFFVNYGGVFGIGNPATDLKLVNSARSNVGLDRLTYQQEYQGVDVFAGVMKVSFNRGNQISAVNGTFIPNLNVSVIPNLSPVAAADKALAAVQV